MPVRVSPNYVVKNYSDRLVRQKTKNTPDQKRWLTEKSKIFQEHHDRKTVDLFFPSLYEEFFAAWPLPAPTEANVQAADGSILSGIYVFHAHFSNFFFIPMLYLFTPAQ